MLRDPKVIEHLNTQLTNELTAVNQYFLHARTLEHWGVTKLGKSEYGESIGEMKHADELIRRILFLDGLPNVQRLDPIRVGEDVEQILKSDQALEEKALNDLRAGIAYCENVRDFVSRDLLLKILESEEKHVDFLDRQFDLHQADRYRALCDAQRCRCAGPRGLSRPRWGWWPSAGLLARHPRPCPAGVSLAAPSQPVVPR